MVEPSRRHRKRAATQEALHAAALRLFAERGYAATTVTDITDAVDVSERTFFRYFPTKEDVLLHDLREMRTRLAEALVGRPAGEPPLRAILAALLVLRTEGRGRLAALIALMPAPPGRAVDDPEGVVQWRPSPRALQIFAEWEAALIGALLARGGTDPRDADAHDVLRAEVTARAALAALRTALNRYRALAGNGRTPDTTFAALVVEAFTILEEGCRPPARPASDARPTSPE